MVEKSLPHLLLRTLRIHFAKNQHEIVIYLNLGYVVYLCNHDSKRNKIINTINNLFKIRAYRECSKQQFKNRSKIAHSENIQKSKTSKSNLSDNWS